MFNNINIALVPLLPLASSILLGLFGRKYIKNAAGIIGTAALLVSAVLSAYIAYEYFFVAGKIDNVYQPIIAMQYNWLQFTPSLSINLGIIIDPISVMMMVVVTFVSLMVHVFSLGYMKGEERYATYYAYLSLFTFSMLGLVISTNIFQTYMFWELVGVSSYLLIGYYFQKPSAVSAAKKAFIVTRFADLGFLIGILILAFHAETLDFQTLIQRLTDANSTQFASSASSTFLGVSALTWGLTLVFMGGAGKSAMFPLHVWLPDAMEGPTPVSALIHAATMVVAGVYLVARLFPIFSFDGAALTVVTYVGAFSALFAAIIACTQTDIKRVLAYSTMSQIGFMMFALGVSGYGGENGLGYMAAMFHLFTHAFFKSLLFLGAGAVIHLVHSNDMNDMGGLRKLMPITHISFLIACFAIAGIPPFAGFFSKEEILLSAFHANTLVYGVALLTSGLTAFYMFRLYFSIFWQKDTEVHDSHGEGPWAMKLPLIILGALALLAGFVPFSSLVTADGMPLETHIDIAFSAAPVLLAAAGILLAMRLYKKANETPAKIALALGGLYHAAYRKFYIDEVYAFVTKKIIFNLIGRPAAWFDKHIVDGLMNAMASVTAAFAGLIKGLQSGKVQQYALYFFGGIVTLTILIIYWW
ncbi:NADH-quinone oxidoreductase subunit L [Limnovirga soli]|uniref:NADH-quinone oxidoreductase subunit L n=1 Tax=Limnovirga soli TaxID=2656915 RepID=A0A8J8JV33_9BACT|nr:NADH-quinone oxidoreductase subunit L [Limnovirga soli]NNV57678.1 NADH-quinone oxidoreductase subunit L [Limnovirga soli]